MSRVPDEVVCGRLLAEAGVGEGVLVHVRAVHQRAVAIAERLVERGHPVRPDVVAAGALLHDVGRAFSGGPAHGAVGADWLRARACSEAVCRCVERHILAGLGPEEAAAAGLADRDLIPRSLEERVVAHADNLTGEDGPRDIDLLLEGLPAGLARRVVELHRELTELAGETL